MKRLAFLAAPLAVAACGFTEVHEAVLRPATGPTAHPVELYMGDEAPGRPYVEAAILQAVGHGGDANLEDLSKALSERAAQLGCDAVVQIRVDQGYTMAHASGVCVRYVSPTSVRPSPPPTPPAAAPPPATRHESDDVDL